MYKYVLTTWDYLLYITFNNEILIKDTPIQKFFNQLLKKQLSDLASREKQTKKNLKFKAKTPIYIDKETLFMCIKSYRLDESLYINYFSILSYEFKNKLVIINFIGNHTMKIRDLYAFKNQIKKCEMILDYIK